MELRRVNQWLGDAQALRNSLLKEIEEQDLRTFKVLDVGAGSGELLRVTAQWANETNRQAWLVGLELNARSASAILEESRDFPQISSVQGDAFHLPFADGAFDYTLCSLFTHHFQDEAVIELLREMNRVARRAVFVIDLHGTRSLIISTRRSAGCFCTKIVTRGRRALDLAQSSPKN